MSQWWALLPATVFAVISLEVYRLHGLDRIPRSHWLSFAGGTAVAYVFMHLMPELSAYNEGHRGSGLAGHIFTMALAGLAVFYGLERYACVHGQGVGNGSVRILLVVHAGTFAFYNFIIGWLLAERTQEGATALLLYTVAMGLHLVISDHGMRKHYERAYQSRVRWLLAASVLTGALGGIALELPPVVFESLVAFLGGGIILNVFKEELPTERLSRFSSFALGVVLYGALLYYLSTGA